MSPDGIRFLLFSCRDADAFCGKTAVPKVVRLVRNAPEAREEVQVTQGKPRGGGRGAGRLRRELGRCRCRRGWIGRYHRGGAFMKRRSCAVTQPVKATGAVDHYMWGALEVRLVVTRVRLLCSRRTACEGDSRDDSDGNGDIDDDENADTPDVYFLFFVYCKRR